MLTIQPLTTDRIVYCASRLVLADRAELDAAGIGDAAQMLMGAVPECAWAEVALWESEPVAMFGVRPMGDVGVPWMLTTISMRRAERAPVARAALRAVRRMRDEFAVLQNLIHADNASAIRFVRWLGFTVDPAPTGPGGRFRLFWWRQACATP
jgi:hypothetical protein